MKDMDGEEVVAGGEVTFAVSPERKMVAQIREVPLKKLNLDQGNVRFHQLNRKLTEEEAEAVIWKEADTKALLGEIRASGGLSEYPFVDSNYVVREGNRRLVCHRKLSEMAHAGKVEEFPKDHWDTVRCYVLAPDTPERDIAILLNRFHVSGKKEWRALNQAAHIWKLSEEHGLTQDAIRTLFSLSKVTVGRMIKAYQTTTDYGKRFQKKDPEWIGKYSYFVEVYKKAKLQDWVDHEGNMDRLMDWIATGKIPTGMDVRYLPDVIENPEAIAALDDVGIEAARQVLSKTDPSVDSSFYGRVLATIAALNEVPRDDLLAAATDEVRRQALVRLRDTTNEVLKNVEALKGLTRPGG